MGEKAELKSENFQRYHDHFEDNKDKEGQWCIFRNN